MLRSSVFALLMFLAGVMSLAGGCASQSFWERNYVPDAALGEKLPPAPLDPKTAPVQIRVITWERMEAAMLQWQRDATDTDVHPEDWSDSKKAEVRARLLKSLQVSSEPAQVSVVGRAAFKTTDGIRPELPADRERLREFARKVGANQVVWSSKHVGTAEAVVHDAVTSYTTGTDSYRDGRRRSEPYSETTTTWIPVRIMKDETAYVAVFLRS